MQQPFPTNLQIHNYDISTLFIETRGWIRLLYRRLARKDGDIVSVYNECIYYLSQLFDAVKHIIRNSGKIENWKQKEKEYKEFFDLILNGEFVPYTTIKIWESLSEDIIESGIYDEDENSMIKLIFKISGRGNA